MVFSVGYLNVFGLFLINDLPAWMVQELLKGVLWRAPEALILLMAVHGAENGDIYGEPLSPFPPVKVHRGRCKRRSLEPSPLTPPPKDCQTPRPTTTFCAKIVTELVPNAIPS
eukprot:1777967-Amphidinium_carterae.1